MTDEDAGVRAFRLASRKTAPPLRRRSTLRSIRVVLGCLTWNSSVDDTRW